MARPKRSGSRNDSSSNKVNGSSATAIADRPKPTAIKNSLIEVTPAAQAVVRQSVSVPVSHEQIAVKAYHLWQQNGGSSESNWLKAEAMLRKQAEIST